MRWRMHLAATSYVWFRTQPSGGRDCGGEPNDAQDGVDYGRRCSGEERRRYRFASKENGWSSVEIELFDFCSLD